VPLPEDRQRAPADAGADHGSSLGPLRRRTTRGELVIWVNRGEVADLTYKRLEADGSFGPARGYESTFSIPVFNA
jgi:hypothetical protein